MVRCCLVEEDLGLLMDGAELGKGGSRLALALNINNKRTTELTKGRWGVMRENTVLFGQLKQEATQKSMPVADRVWG